MVKEISIDFNDGQVTFRTNRCYNVISYECNDMSELGEIMQEYYNKYVKDLEW